MGRTIDIWKACLQAPSSALARCASTLSTDERARAGQFRFDHLQREFILTRGILRILLGRYLGVEAPAIQFAYGPKGKPHLVECSRTHFNLAHSGELAVFAFALDCEVGVDVEKIRPISDLAQIGERFFCAAETEELLSEEPSARQEMFFRCWTRKEAYIKAVGEGVTIPLSNFRVTLKRTDPVKFVHISGNLNEAKAWVLHDLPLTPAYAGAVAYRADAHALRMHEVKTGGDWTRLLGR